MNTLSQFYQEIPNTKALRWNRWQTNKTKEGTRRIVVTKSGTKSDLIDNDLEKPSQGTTFFKHMHTAKWQSKQFDKIKHDLPKGLTLQIMDFAKNRAVIYQDEIKAAFYTQNQVTLHPIVTYYRNKEGNLVRESSIIISEDNQHD